MNAGKLEEQITNEKLRNLQRLFEEADEDGGGGLDIDEFRIAMQQTMPGVDAHELEIIFMKVDTNCDGTVDWDEYLSYMLLEYKEKDQMTSMLQEKPFPKPLREISSNHRDDICRITFLPTLQNKHDNRSDKVDFLHGRYLSVSREGVVNFWSLEMNNLKTNVLEYTKDKTLWVTDLVCLPNVSMLAIASTERDVSLLDLNANKFDRSYRISGLDHCVLSMDYWFDNKNLNNAVLMWGDAGGNVCAIVFKECMNSGGLFANYAGKKVSIGQRIPIGELLKGKVKGVTAHKLTALHDDWICQVRFFPTLDCFISCCVSGPTAMYMGDLGQKKVTSYFVNRKGILCFDYDKVSNIIVTGGMDHLVRVWNPYVNSKAIVVFKGHTKAVEHVIINPVNEQVISIAKDKTIRVYNLSDQSCAQTIPGSKITIGPHYITAVFLNARTQSLILGTNQLAIFERKDEERQQVVKTHNAPITSAIYNTLFNQVVIGCHESTVSVWDLNTGEKVIQYTNAHKITEKGEEKGIEITAMVFDPTGRRLITGARDGTVKIWNFNNGAMLREFETVGDSEITGLVCPRQRILISGWNRRVTSYIDAKDMEDEEPTVWDVKHHDDILSMAHNGSSSLATGSYDGDVILWSLETGQVLCRLNPREGTKPQTVVKPIKQPRPPTAFSMTSRGVTDMNQEQLSSLVPSSNQDTPRAVERERTFMSVKEWVNEKSKNRKTLLPASSSGRRSQQEEDPSVKLPDLGTKSRNLVQSSVDQHPVYMEEKSSGGWKSKDGTKSLDGAATISSEEAVPATPRNEHDQPVTVRTSYSAADDDEEDGRSYSIDKVLFLTRREVGMDTATLMTGGGEGWVRAWSVHHKGGLLGQFVAVHKPDECVTSMFVDPRNEFLATGDSAGYVKVWDISDYCISDEQFAKIFPGDRKKMKEERQRRFPYFRFDKKTKEIRDRCIAFDQLPTPNNNSDPLRTMKMPVLLNSFRAHLKSITCLDFIEKRDMIISSSSDCSARLWTLCGRYIGTFGQTRPWDIRPVEKPKDLPYYAPSDVKKVGSAATLQVLKGGTRNRWKMARNVVLLWILKSKKDSYGNIKSFHDIEPQREESPVSVVSESILGKYYKPKVRHKIAPTLPPIKHSQNQVVVYSSLPFNDLTPQEECEASTELKEIQKRHNLTTSLDQGGSSKFAQKTRPALQGRRLFQRSVTKGSMVANNGRMDIEAVLSAMKGRAADNAGERLSTVVLGPGKNKADPARHQPLRSLNESADEKRKGNRFI
ncbi:WD repeat-containing protein on Y chromosome-like [Lineus longissimus]|uniref:WD repeat-containing protein on Y chromosome-like n=1 Tax=Lineus longissimus TaxID=88925 RepID=UPI00315D1C79